MLYPRLSPASLPYNPSIYTEPSTCLTYSFQDIDETPDYTEDSDTNPNTTASSVVGEPLTADGRKRRSEATQLRRSVFGKKHDRLGESKVHCSFMILRIIACNKLMLE
jgi:SWI/SNF-related matrix-associated actin-dependent regulator of chromatin subfamily A member 5